MTQDTNGPVPPLPVPHTYARRQGKGLERRLAAIKARVVADGAAYNPKALAEEIGLPVNAIQRFAAQVVVHEKMVELAMIEPEDAIRMGSAGLAASLRIEAARRNCPVISLHRAVRFTSPAKQLHTSDVMGLRRLARRAGQDRRLVVAPRTICGRCGAVARVQGDCIHQRVMTPNETAQGLPHA